MDTGAWQTTVHWGRKKSDMTEQLTLSFSLKTYFHQVDGGEKNLFLFFFFFIFFEKNLFQNTVSTRVSQCSSQHRLQQPGHGSNLAVHLQTNGQESCGTYTQWNITQLLKKNVFESVLTRWMKLEPIIQSEVSQKEKHQYSILTHIYGIQKDGNDNPVCETAKETQMYRTVFWTLWERERVG